MIKSSLPPAPEFSRPLEVARVPRMGSHEKLLADARECAALAKRLLLPAVHSVSAHLQAKPWRGGGLKVWGEAVVDMTQESVVSLEAFRTTQTVQVERYYLNVKGAEEADSELEIDPIEQGIVDLGELVAESIALELDPYPRKPGEVFVSAELEELSPDPEKPNPFNVLKLPERKR
jgi:uncharacterized metal-binding protein YceD (DUF177 family)